MEERVFSLFQNESYKSKFPYMNIKESGDIFWQCDLIEVIVYNSEIIKDDLDIFEKTILKMIDYHGYSTKELSEIVCIEEDLVEYLISTIEKYGIWVDPIASGITLPDTVCMRYKKCAAKSNVKERRVKHKSLLYVYIICKPSRNPFS